MNTVRQRDSPSNQQLSSVIQEFTSWLRFQHKIKVNLRSTYTAQLHASHRRTARTDHLFASWKSCVVNILDANAIAKNTTLNRDPASSMRDSVMLAPPNAYLLTSSATIAPTVTLAIAPSGIRFVTDVRRRRVPTKKYAPIIKYVEIAIENAGPR